MSTTTTSIENLHTPFQPMEIGQYGHESDQATQATSTISVHNTWRWKKIMVRINVNKDIDNKGQLWKNCLLHSSSLPRWPQLAHRWGANSSSTLVQALSASSFCPGSVNLRRADMVHTCFRQSKAWWTSRLRITSTVDLCWSWGRLVPGT